MAVPGVEPPFGVQSVRELLGLVLRYPGILGIVLKLGIELSSKMTIP